MNPNSNNSSDRDRPEDGRRDDAFVQKMLGEHFDIDPPDPQFVDRLSQQLDAEFASTLSGAPNLSTDPAIQNDSPVRLADDTNRRKTCLLYTSPSPRDLSTSRMPSSA